VTDPLWTEYLDAVRGLGQLPELRDERRRQASAHEQAAVRQARAALDTELHRCDEWSTIAGRAMSTAEARLVAAQVLVPDVAAAPPPPAGAPAELVALVQQTEHELATDLAGLDTARRRARQRAIERAQRAKELAARRRQVIKFAAVGGAVVVALLVLAFVFS
jgi:hypothetical protein